MVSAADDEYSEFAATVLQHGRYINHIVAGPQGPVMKGWVRLRLQPGLFLSSVIDGAATTNRQHRDNSHLIAQFADDAIIPTR